MSLFAVPPPVCMLGLSVPACSKQLCIPRVQRGCRARQAKHLPNGARPASNLRHPLCAAASQAALACQRCALGPAGRVRVGHRLPYPQVPRQLEAGLLARLHGRQRVLQLLRALLLGVPLRLPAGAGVRVCAAAARYGGRTRRRRARHNSFKE